MPPRIAAWLILAMAFVVLLFNSGARFAMGLMLHPMVVDLGWTRTTLSSVVTVFMIVSATALPFTGMMVDRFGAVFVLTAGVVLSAVGVSLMSVINTPTQAILLYGMLFAIGSAATSITPIGVILSRWYPDRMGMANSVAISGMGVGQLLIIAVLTSQLMVVGWRGAYLWLGIATFVFVMPFVWYAGRIGASSSPRSPAPSHPEPNSYEPNPPGMNAREPDQIGITLMASLRTTQTWILLGIYAICGFQDFLIATHIVAFALDEQVSTSVAGNMLAFMGLTGLAGVLLTGVMNDWRGPKLPTLVCFVIRVVIFAIILFSRDTYVIVGVALLYGATFWMTAPLTVVFARVFCGMAYLGSITGMITMVHHVFGGIGAFVAARLFDSSGSYDGALQLMLVLSVTGLVLTLLLDRRCWQTNYVAHS